MQSTQTGRVRKSEARRLLEVGQAETAATLLCEAIADGETDAETYSLLATALSLSGRENESLSWYEWAVVMEPLEPLYHFNLGLARERRGDRDGAKLAYQRATLVNTTYRPAFDALQRLSLPVMPTGVHVPMTPGFARTSAEPRSTPATGSSPAAQGTPPGYDMPGLNSPSPSGQTAPGYTPPAGYDFGSSSAARAPYGSPQDYSSLTEMSDWKYAPSGPRDARLLAILLVPLLTLALWSLLSPDSSQEPLPPGVQAIAVLFFGVSWLAHAWLIYAHKKAVRAAYYVQIVMSCFGLIFFPLGTLIQGSLLVKFGKPETKRWYKIQ